MKRSRQEEFHLAADLLEKAVESLRAQADGARLDVRAPASTDLWFRYAEIGKDLDGSEILLSALGMPMLADAVNRIGEALEAISRTAGDDTPSRDDFGSD